jgi:hypothetical protein
VAECEEVAGCDEKQRHMKSIDEISKQFGSLRMAYNHEDNGNPFANRDCVVALCHRGGGGKA